MMRSVRNENGFTLVEILVATGLMAMGVAAIAGIMTQGNRATRSLASSVGFSMFMSNANLTLGTELVCKSVFQDRAFDFENAVVVTDEITKKPRFKDPLPAGDLDSIAGNFVGSGLKVEGRFVYATPLGLRTRPASLPPGNPLKAFLATLEIKGIRNFENHADDPVGVNRPVVGGNELKPWQFMVVMVMDPDAAVPKVVTCSSVPDQLEAMCDSLGGVFNKDTHKCALNGGFGGRFMMNVSHQESTIAQTEAWIAANDGPPPSGRCNLPNPLTGTCSCPTGFTPKWDYHYVAEAPQCSTGQYIYGFLDSSGQGHCGVFGYSCIRMP